MMRLALPILGNPDSSVQMASFHRSSVMMTELSYEDLVALLRGGKLHLVDVREPSEIKETGKIPGAINIPRTFQFIVSALVCIILSRDYHI